VRGHQALFRRQILGALAQVLGPEQLAPDRPGEQVFPAGRRLLEQSAE
jgi:hypothetical protein